jgi:hypothetical protein
MVRKNEDIYTEDCITALLPSIEGDEATWRKNVRIAMKVFLSKRYLPLQAIVSDAMARLELLEKRTEHFEKTMKEEHVKVMEKVSSIEKGLIEINSGISLLKFLVPGVPVLIGGIIGVLVWILHVMKMVP